MFTNTLLCIICHLSSLTTQHFKSSNLILENQYNLGVQKEIATGVLDAHL